MGSTHIWILWHCCISHGLQECRGMTITEFGGYSADTPLLDRLQHLDFFRSESKAGANVIVASTFDQCPALPLRCLFGMAPIQTQTMPVQVATCHRFRRQTAPNLESVARSALARNKDPKEIFPHPPDGLLPITSRATPQNAVALAQSTGCHYCPEFTNVLT